MSSQTNTSQTEQVLADPVPAGGPVKNWIFCLNNPDIETRGPWYLDDMFPEGSRYIYQLEQGDNGTFHYQGYITLKEPLRFNQMREILPGAHIEKRKGTHKEAYAYHTKEETRVEGPHGNMEEKQRSGQRTDLIEAKRLILGLSCIYYLLLVFMTCI